MCSFKTSMNVLETISMFPGSGGIVTRPVKHLLFAFARGERHDLPAILVESARVFNTLLILACHLNPHPHLSTK